MDKVILLRLYTSFVGTKNHYMQAPLIGRLLVVYFGGTSGSDSKIWDLGFYKLVKFVVSS